MQILHKWTENVSIFVPTFDTKVTEYLCSGVFFGQISTFKLTIFDQNLMQS